MRTFCTIGILFAIALMLFTSVTEPTVAQASDFTINPSGSIFGANSLKPGDTISKKITISNHKDEASNVSLCTAHLVTSPLASQITITATSTNGKIWQKKLSEMSDCSQTNLGILAPQSSTIFTLTAHLNEHLANTYQNEKIDDFAFTFNFSPVADSEIASNLLDKNGIIKAANAASSNIANTSHRLNFKLFFPSLLIFSLMLVILYYGLKEE